MPTVLRTAALEFQWPCFPHLRHSSRFRKQKMHLYWSEHAADKLPPIPPLRCIQYTTVYLKIRILGDMFLGVSQCTLLARLSSVWIKWSDHMFLVDIVHNLFIHGFCVSIEMVNVMLSELCAQADPPDVSLIPASDVVGVTVLLLTCSYRDKVGQ